jgi:hypothetical protein
MKKTLLALAATVVALAAAAQNRAIDRLAQRYTDVEGYTVINLTDGAVQSLAGMIPTDKLGDARITVDGTTFTAADLLSKVSLVTAIVAKNGDDAFARRARQTLRGDYTELASITSDKVTVKLLWAEIRGGRYSGNNEVVALVLADDATVLARVVGQIDAKLLSRVAQEIQKR